MEIDVRRGYYGKSGFLVEGILFLLVFFAVFCIILLLPDAVVEQHDDMISLIALLLAAAAATLAAYITDQKLGVTQQLLVIFEEDHCVLQKGRREWSVPYREISEAVKIMVINRFFYEKGAYRLTIHWKGHRSITFWTTDQEYQEHKDFEDTQLYELYLGLRSHGVKCC